MGKIDIENIEIERISNGYLVEYWTKRFSKDGEYVKVYCKDVAETRKKVDELLEDSADES